MVVEVEVEVEVVVVVEVEEDRRSWELELLEGRDSRPRDISELNSSGSSLVSTRPPVEGPSSVWATVLGL